MTDITREQIFQNDIIEQMLAQGWVLGSSKNYERTTALYEQDALDYINNLIETDSKNKIFFVYKAN